jgi:hypothetical protein
VNIAPPINLAPVRPLFSLAENEEAPKYLCDGLTELLKDKLGKDTDLWKEIAETTEITSNFIQGKQIFQQTTSGWRIQNIRRTNPNKISCINLMQFYCTQNLQRIVSSNPDIEPAEEFRRAAFKEKVKKNKAVWNGYERKFYTTWFDHQEALHAIISGTYIESVQYDHLAQGTQVFQELWGEKKVPISDGMGACFSCAYEGDYKNFQNTQCPECGSADTYTEQPVYQFVPSVVGQQPVQMGDLSLKLIPVQSVRFDPKVQAENSSWFLERTRMSKGRLAHILGRKMSLGEPVADRGLDSLDSISKAGNTLFGHDTFHAPTQSDDVTIDRLSLKPEDYTHLSTREEDTVSGQKLPAAKLTKLFPNGCVVVYANEQHILGIYPDVHHSQEISSGVFHMRMSSGLGRGSEDTVEVQKRFSRNDAQMLRAGESGATPAHWFVEGAVDRKHVKQIGMPGFAIPVKQAVASALGKTELVGQIPPSNVAGTFFQYTYEALDKYRQMVSHAPDVTNNLTGGNRSGTATEAQISDANAEALYGPMLQMKAAVRKGTAAKTIALFAKHFKGVSKYFTYGTTKQDLAVGENIKGEDVDPEIQFVVVANSERPKTRYTQKQAFAEMMAIVGGAEGLVALKQVAPDLLSEMLKTFDLELAIDDYDTIEDLCWRRLKQVLEIGREFDKEVQGQLPLIPEIVLLGLRPQIRPTEPYHAEKAVWFSEYLDTPDAVELSEKDREAIDILIMAHRNGGVIQMGNILQGQSEAQVIGQQPIMEQQAAMAEQQAQTEMAGQEAQNEHEAGMMEGETINNAMQLEDSAAQREHDERMMGKEQGFQEKQSKFQSKESDKDRKHQKDMDKSKVSLEKEKIKAAKSKNAKSSRK